MFIAVIFIIIFIITLKSLEEGDIFGEYTNIIMALCVAFLCILGMQQFFSVRISTTEQINVPAQISAESLEKISEEDRKKEIYLFPLLFPYTVLALTLLLLPFILMIAAIIQSGRNKKIFKGTLNRIMKTRIKENTNRRILLRK